ncbi:hypothetical protein AP1_0143 [Aeromonas phage AP1]|nr:hypothetical protein AP1_0143 [Aeromonas phage AP1]
MKIRFKSEQAMKEFKAVSIENLEIAHFMRMKPVEVVKSNGHYYIETDILDCTLILESERDFFDWIEDDPKTLFDIMLEKKAEYDKAFNDYIQSVKENS